MSRLADGFEPMIVVSWSPCDMASRRRFCRRPAHDPQLIVDPSAFDVAMSPLLGQMINEGIPVTRENYLALAYGETHPHLDAEAESMLPLCLQEEE
jgi:hypothetical protein